MKKRVAAGQGWRCAACTSLLPATFQVDHAVPHAVGGGDDPQNLRALCANCHAEKTQREAARIRLHTTLSAAVAQSAIRTSCYPCWGCHRVLSSYFPHR